MNGMVPPGDRSSKSENGNSELARSHIVDDLLDHCFIPRNDEQRAKAKRDPSTASRAAQTPRDERQRVASLRMTAVLMVGG
jgi:hypothetical protein